MNAQVEIQAALTNLDKLELLCGRNPISASPREAILRLFTLATLEANRAVLNVALKRYGIFSSPQHMPKQVAEAYKLAQQINYSVKGQQ